MNSLKIYAHSWLFLLYFNLFFSYFSNKLLYCSSQSRHSLFNSLYYTSHEDTLLLIISKLFLSSISLFDEMDLWFSSSSSNSSLYSLSFSFSYFNSLITCFKLLISILCFSSLSWALVFTDVIWCKFFKELAVICSSLNRFKSFLSSSISLQ